MDGRIVKTPGVCGGAATQSQIFREALKAWADQQESAVSPFNAMADLVGVVRGGNPDRSSDTGRQFARLLGGRRDRTVK